MGRRNLSLLLPFIFLFFIFFIATISYRYFQPEEYDLASVENFDLFIFSSYYFNKSKSLGDDAVVIVFTADFELIELYPQLEIQLTSKEEIKYVLSDIKLITPHQKCKWVDYYAIIEGIPSVEKIAINTGFSFAEIPVTAPSTGFHDTVTCIAPLYASEQWQVAIMAAHTYKRFGSHIHLYVRSMVSPLFELMKEYEKEGYLTLQTWHRILLKSVPVEDFNPNLNVEFRSQAAAQTDCLLQYKETASFVSFVDLDDILIPRLGATYFDEFDEIYNKIPHAAYLFYGKENTQSVASKSPQDFSVAELIYSIEYQQKMEMGKFVVQPKYVNASWIHWPPSVPRGMKKHIVKNSVNSITHLKIVERMSRRTLYGSEIPLYLPDKTMEYNPRELLSEEDLEAIEDDYQRMLTKQKVKETVNRLPKMFFYADLIGNCYQDFYRLFYSNQLQRIKCFGPERCLFPPSPGIPCYNAVAKYKSEKGNTHNIHFAINSHFEESDGCIR